MIANSSRFIRGTRTKVLSCQEQATMEIFLFSYFLDGEADTSGDEDGDRRPSSTESVERPGSRSNEDSIPDSGSQFKAPGTKPLDLTTKI